MTATINAEVDLHVHSLASGHAYSTIGEIATAAAARGLRGVAMTDHGPAMPAAPHPYHFECLYMIPDYLSGVRIIKGVEANIVGPGRVDLCDRLLDKMDVVLAGFHHDCGFGPSDCKANTRAIRVFHSITKPWRVRPRLPARLWKSTTRHSSPAALAVPTTAD
jgi:putative hydrolase